MTDQTIYWGAAPLFNDQSTTTGKYVTRREEESYEITGYDEIDPFLVTLASPSDHWMYLSSRGGLTCGRKTPDHALFPYYTDDKIHDGADTTGPFTSIIVNDGTLASLWRPFLDAVPTVYEVTRRMYKNATGSSLTYEEHNRTLELRFSFTWEQSDRYGFVRTAVLQNDGASRSFSILDGIRNLLPAGIDRIGQQRVSTLLDGYKQCELDGTTGTGIYTLGSILTDRAEPSEALRATTVFRVGLPDAKVLLSENQVSAIQRGAAPVEERYMRGRRGAYLCCSAITLGAGKSEEWMIVADVEQDSAAALRTREFILTDNRIAETIRRDIGRGREELERLVASADGIQLTGDRLTVNRHYSNVLFNIMRGGVFLAGYRIDTADLSRFLSGRNSTVALRHERFLSSLPPSLHVDDLRVRAQSEGDPDLLRLCLEYLPLIFSRRHGDPSRPWNRFAVDVRDAEGRQRVTYQGNWRDIFQNWEALARSYPRFLTPIIAKFLNASTADGYNPYRISQDGIEWETYDPDDPWSNIGYWGDHQIVYLYRLLELAFRHDPEEVRGLLAQPIFAFADVPYRIASFGEILADPYATVSYDDERAATATVRVKEVGADGKLLFQGTEPYHATMIEKLLITTLTKLSNLVPGGGVWMNTQRPEWNDANNALAGWGLSIVTTAYLHRFVSFLLDLIPAELSTGDNSAKSTVKTTAAVVTFFREIAAVCADPGMDGAERDDTVRFAFLTAAGSAGERYRNSVYDGSFGAQHESLRYGEIREFLGNAEQILTATLRTNRRDDGLYHSYNVLEIEGESAAIHRLDEMLEGQVAILSAGVLNAAETLELLDALRQSRLYRADQNSYTLYPDRSLPGFLEKNVIPGDVVAASPILRRVTDLPGQQVIVTDIKGGYHFHSDIRNAEFLRQRLPSLGLTDSENGEILAAYETVFKHRRFTGRSGTFFKYEGLGSIYWHMVSKLRLTVAETIAADRDENPDVVAELTERLKQIRMGIGVHKSPAEYGAFPTDPYSHTPSFTGVQQPGMTGQVKEDIISRFTELGVEIHEGRIRFGIVDLNRDEFLAEPTPYTYYDINGERRDTTVNEGELAFTYCNIPIVYRTGTTWSGTIHTQDGQSTFDPAVGLPVDLSREVFARTGGVTRIDLTIPGDAIGV